MKYKNMYTKGYHVGRSGRSVGGK